MEAQTNKYHLTLRQLQLANGKCEPHKQIELEMDNHDELFQIIDKLKAKDPFGDIEQVAQFAIGLKMFSGVMIKHRHHPLFKDLSTSYRLFMMKLKGL